MNARTLFDPRQRPRVPFGEAGWSPDELLLSDPERYIELLQIWRLLLRSATDVGDAIDRADAGEQPPETALDFNNPEVVRAYQQAFDDVRRERRRRLRDRKKLDLLAAGLLTVFRLGLPLQDIA